jgi:hypothetical protein
LTNEGIKVVDYELLETDPGIRPPISSYHPDIQDEVRKAYLKIRGHQPPNNFVYPWSDFGGTRRRFNKNWFNLYDWLEYSESKDLAFCLPWFSHSQSFFLVIHISHRVTHLKNNGEF